MSANIDALIPEFQPYAAELVRLAGQAGFQPRVTSTRRSSSEQKRLYDRYLAGQSTLPAAPPGRSAHEYGYAIDIALADPQDSFDLGDLWTSNGGIWSPKDWVHYEYPGFRQVAGSATGPVAGAGIYKLVDFLSSFVPYLGEAQLLDAVIAFFGIDPLPSDVSWYLQHPAEAIRDILS